MLRKSNEGCVCVLCASLIFQAGLKTREGEQDPGNTKKQELRITVMSSALARTQIKER